MYRDLEYAAEQIRRAQESTNENVKKDCAQRAIDALERVVAWQEDDPPSGVVEMTF